MRTSRLAVPSSGATVERYAWSELYCAVHPDDDVSNPGSDIKLAVVAAIAPVADNAPSRSKHAALDMNTSPVCEGWQAREGDVFTQCSNPMTSTTTGCVVAHLSPMCSDPSC